MKLGPFVTAQGAVSGGSTAAGKDVQNAISKGYNRAQNAGTVAKFGNQVLSTGLAADLNKQRATVAAAENDVRALLEQNPDYIDADTVEEMGVEVDEANVVEGEDGARRVRTYSVAEDMYRKGVEGGVEDAHNKLSFPAVGQRLNNEVDAKYRNAGQNRVATWAVGKQREVSRAEFTDQVEMLRANGQYEEANAITETSRAAGNINDAEANNEREVTAVSKEMRGTNITIIDAQNDFTKAPVLEARIEAYEDHIANGTTPTDGMTSDDVYSERNRMVSVHNSIQSAQNTKQSVSLVGAKADLDSVVDAAGTGVPTISGGQINNIESNINALYSQGAITEKERDGIQLKIDSARVVSRHDEYFSHMRTGDAGEALRAQQDTYAIARRIGGRDGVLLARKAEAAYKKRVSALASDSAMYVANTNPAVGGALRDFDSSPNQDTLVNFLKLSKQAQEDAGMYSANVTGFSEKHPYIQGVKKKLNSSWQEATEVFNNMDGLSAEDKVLVAKSFGGNDKESLLAQSVMLTYESDPDAARQIHAGSKLNNVQINQEELRMKVRAEVKESMDPLAADAMIPAIESFIRYNVAEGNMNKEVGTTDVQQVVARLAGPKVAFVAPTMRFNTKADKYFANSSPTRSYRDDTGNWKSPEDVKNGLMEYMVNDTNTYMVGGSMMTLHEMREFVDISHESDGKYRIDVQQGPGISSTLLDEDRKPVIIDLKSDSL